MQLALAGSRYTKAALAVLMRLQGYAKIPAVPAIPRPDREQFAAGMDALEENDILSSVGGRLLLDRVHAFLIENLCDCDRYFTVSGGKAFLAACACPKVFITVSSRNGASWVLHVATDLADLLEDFREEAARFRDGGAIRFSSGGELKETKAPDRETLEKEMEKAIAILRKREELFG